MRNFSAGAALVIRDLRNGDAGVAGCWNEFFVLVALA
jgi:hypothetical protein